MGYITIEPPFDMDSLAGFNGCMQGGNEVEEVKQESADQIGNIPVGDLLITEKDGYRPPESETVDQENRELGDKGMDAVPANKIGTFPVGKVKEEGCRQIDDRQRKPYHENHQ